MKLKIEPDKLTETEQVVFTLQFNYTLPTNLEVSEFLGIWTCYNKQYIPCI